MTDGVVISVPGAMGSATPCHELEHSAATDEARAQRAVAGGSDPGLVRLCLERTDSHKQERGS